MSLNICSKFLSQNLLTEYSVSPYTENLSQEMLKDRLFSFHQLKTFIMRNTRKTLYLQKFFYCLFPTVIDLKIISRNTIQATPETTGVTLKNRPKSIRTLAFQEEERKQFYFKKMCIKSYADFLNKFLFLSKAYLTKSV